MSKILGSEFLKEVSAKLKVNRDKVTIENKVFLLFSKVTVAFLFLCCGLVTLQELIGKKVLFYHRFKAANCAIFPTTYFTAGQHIQCIAPPKEDLGSYTMN